MSNRIAKLFECVEPSLLCAKQVCQRLMLGVQWTEKTAVEEIAFSTRLVIAFVSISEYSKLVLERPRQIVQATSQMNVERVEMYVQFGAGVRVQHFLSARIADTFDVKTAGLHEQYSPLKSLENVLTSGR